jgi:hypothetical protein
MKKTVVIHQPDFLSYLGFFHRLLSADIYIALDDVQYVSGTSRSWTNRDKIKTKNGDKWLTLSVKKATRDTKINQIELNETVNWKKNNLDLLKQNYKNSEFFAEIFPYIENMYKNSEGNMSKFNMNSIIILIKLFDIKVEIIQSSSLHTTRVKSERLVDLITEVNATHYLSGIGAKDYHKDGPFKDANIKVIWQKFTHPIYPQLHGEFIPYLSSIDLLFNCGIEQSRKILRSC